AARPRSATPGAGGGPRRYSAPINPTRGTPPTWPATAASRDLAVAPAVTRAILAHESVKAAQATPLLRHPAGSIGEAAGVIPRIFQKNALTPAARSMNPQLVNEHGPVRVELIVADARGKHHQGTGVLDRHPPCLVDNLAVDARPERRGSVGIAGLEHEGLLDLRVDPLVAELGSIQVHRIARDKGAAGQQRADEV